MMHVCAMLVMLCTGCFIGILGGLFGIGGGLIAIPMLGIFFGMTEQAAQGTAIIMVISNLAVGMRNYHKRKKLDWRAGLLIGASSIPSGLLASWYATHLSSTLLREWFAVFLLCLAIETARRAHFYAVIGDLPDGSELEMRSSISTLWALALGIASGCLGGLFGIGGGLFAVIMLTIFFGYPQMTAQGVSLISVIPGAFINLFMYNKAGDIHWQTGVLLALGGFVTVPMGVRIAVGLREKMLKTLFAGLSGISSVGLLLHR